MCIRDSNNNIEESYLSKIILDDQNRLNQFSNIGFQKHLTSMDEIELINKIVGFNSHITVKPYEKEIKVGKIDRNSGDWKNKKANKIALKRLKKAQNCINNNDFDSFLEEIEKSIWVYFADKFKLPMALLRCNYYPKRSSELSDKDFGIAPHTDYGCLTLLFTDATPGLEVELPSKKWEKVTANKEIRILWNAPRAWLVISSKKNIVSSWFQQTLWI
mgnify:CR=1 FL=1